MKSLQTLVVITVLVIQVFSQNYYNQGNNNFGRQSNYNNGGAPQRAVSSSCPEPNGTFPTRTCDGYIQCVNGQSEEKLCPDGLLFKPSAGSPCQYPIDVDCTGREQTQPALSTEECPHQFGYFRIGDERNCGQFKNCVDGRGFVFDCPEGLAFNGDTYRCDWPDQVSSCNAEAYLGFSCPQEVRTNSIFSSENEYKFFRSPNDCQRYFICVNNKPRLYNCGKGRAFNDLINSCDGIENVTGCALPSIEYTDNDFGRSPPVRGNTYRATNYRG